MTPPDDLDGAFFAGPHYFEFYGSDYFVTAESDARGHEPADLPDEEETGADAAASDWAAETGEAIDDAHGDDFFGPDYFEGRSEDRGDDETGARGDGADDWDDDWEHDWTDDWEEDWEDDWSDEQVGDDVGPAAAATSYDDPEVDRRPQLVTAPLALEPGRPPLGRPTVLGLVGAGLALLVAGAIVVFLVLGRGPDQTTPTPPEHAVGFHPPVAVPANGEYVRARVLPSGDLEVDHWIRSKALIFELTLSTPRVAGLEPSRLVASQVKVQTDGQTVSGPSSVSTKAGSYSFIGAKEVHVSYVLYGAVARSSTGGHRALARVTSLDVSYGNDRGPSTVSVVGGRVLTLACSSSGPAARPRPCGAQDGSAWHVDLSPSQRHDRVMAQLDLS